MWVALCQVNAQDGCQQGGGAHGLQSSTKKSRFNTTLGRPLEELRRLDGREVDEPTNLLVGMYAGSLEGE